MNFRRVTRGWVGSCLVAVMVGLILGCEHNEPQTPAPANVGGLWTVVGIWNGKAEVKFEQNGSQVFALVAKNNTFLTFHGVMTGDALAGTFVPSNGGQPITLDAQVSGNDMRGWWEMSPDSGVFTATRK